jgi:hypothetical protein
MVLSGEQGLALQHLGKDASRTPDVDFHIVFLPRQHDLGSAIVSRRDVASHLGVLYTGQTKIANLQITVLVHKDIARLQVTVDDTGRVDVFQPTLFLSVVCRAGQIQSRTRIW